MFDRVKENPKDEMALMKASISISALLKSIKNAKMYSNPKPNLVIEFSKNNARAILYDCYIGVQEWIEDKNQYMYVAVGWSPDEDISGGNLEIIDIRFLDQDDHHLFEEAVNHFVKIISNCDFYTRKIDNRVDIPEIIEEIIKVWSSSLETKHEIIH